VINETVDDNPAIKYDHLGLICIIFVNINIDIREDAIAAEPVQNSANCRWAGVWACINNISSFAIDPSTNPVIIPSKANIVVGFTISVIL